MQVAALLIRSRLIDWQRKKTRHQGHISLHEENGGEDDRTLIDSLADERDYYEEAAIHVDEVLRYFAVQAFVGNMDSYIGKTGHNYFLYEEDGILQILPWDYNLAFATYSLGMPDPISDSTLYVNYPINTPASGEIMRNRPLYHNLMKRNEYSPQYHEYFDYRIESYFESGYFEQFVHQTADMISPYVQNDPTAFFPYKDYLLGVETITSFCLLRAESVRGQLDGTIPSTIAAQAKDKSQFIDASSV